MSAGRHASRPDSIDLARKRLEIADQKLASATGRGVAPGALRVLQRAVEAAEVAYFDACDAYAR